MIELPTYEEMFYYVKRTLEKNQGEVKEKYWLKFRKRSEHIKRTCIWLSRLITEPSDLEIADPYPLMTAAIFHDCGYRLENHQVSKKNHGALGAEIFSKFAEDKGYEKAQIDKIAGWILHHSNKSLLKETETEPELILLLEADILDEEGALSIVCDCMAQGMLGADDYYNAICRLQKFSAVILKENPMVTKKAKLYWKQKQQIVQSFLEALEVDLGKDILDKCDLPVI